MPAETTPMESDVPLAAAAAAGEQAHRWRLQLAADGCMKFSHFANVARASMAVPESGVYFTEANADAQAAHERRHEVQSLPAFEADAGVGPHTCTSHLQFAREKAAPSGQLDRTGVCGFVCRHGTPCKGGFVDMPAPEQFQYYFCLLASLLRRRPDLLHGRVYIDIACRLSGSWRAWVGQQAPTGAALAIWASLRMVVPWMHAAGHNLACQLLYSALFEVSYKTLIGFLVHGKAVSLCCRSLHMLLQLSSGSCWESNRRMLRAAVELNQRCRQVGPLYEPPPPHGGDGRCARHSFGRQTVGLGRHTC